MKYLHSFKRILLSLLLLTGVMGTAVPAVASSSEDGKVDVKEIVLGHMSDSYEWHITTWNGHHISIPLPVIV